MKYLKAVNLQRFADGGDGGSDTQGRETGTGNSSQGGGAVYTYEQLEEVASARASKAERHAITDYLRRKGMSEEDITSAIDDYKAKRKASQPDISKIEKERDDALGKVEQFENEKILVKKGVRADDLDYVSFKVRQLVTDKKNFESAADEYLKENPRYAGGSHPYKVSTGVSSGNAGGTETKNEQINNMIRDAFRR